MDIVVALDIGCTHCAYAYSTRREYEDDPMLIHMNEEWLSGHANLHTYKTTSNMLLTSEKVLHSFGYEADRKYAELLEGKGADQWYYFKRFKAALKCKQIRKDTVIEEEGGKDLPVVALYQLAYKYLKGQLLSTLGLSDKGGSDTNYRIRYMLTVPPKWDNVSRDIIKTAAKKAGMSYFSIITESEATGRYCRFLPLRVPGADDMIYIQRPGSRHVIVNIGGCVVDTTVQEIKTDGSLEEFAKNLGNAHGGCRVDQEFLRFMSLILGTDVMDTFQKKHFVDALNLYQEFEVRKRQCSLDNEDATELILPESLIRLYTSKNKQNLQSSIDESEFAGRVLAQETSLLLDKSIMKDLFSPVIKSIIPYLTTLTKDPEVRQSDAVILTGGFAESTILEGAIGYYFPKSKFIFPPDPDLAVILGGVLMGHCPTPSVTIEAQCTFGVAIAVPFNAKLHPKKKCFEAAGRSFCSDVFQVHIPLGEKLELGKMWKGHQLHPNRGRQKILSVPVYASNRKNPCFTTDSGCVSMGKLVVDLTDGHGALRIQMTYLGRSLVVEAVDDFEQIVAQAAFPVSFARPSSY